MPTPEQPQPGEPATLPRDSYYRGSVDWATTITAAGAFLGGLALPIAFIQLGAQREDRLRAQVNKVGAWAGPASRRTVSEEQKKQDGRSWRKKLDEEWAIPLCIRNSSELPIVVNNHDWDVQPYDPEYTEKLLAPHGVKADTWSYSSPPGTLAPGETWTGECQYPDWPSKFGVITPPPVGSLYRMVLTDAAGNQWEIRPGRAKPPRRVRRKRQGAE